MLGFEALGVLALGQGVDTVASQTLTATKFSNTNSFGAAVVTADTTRTLRPTKLSNTNTFGTPVVVRKLQQVFPTKYTNTNTFGTPKVNAGVQPTKFTNTNSFGNAGVKRLKETYFDYFDGDVLNTNLIPTKWYQEDSNPDVFQVQTDSLYGRKLVYIETNSYSQIGFDAPAFDINGNDTPYADQDLLALVKISTQPNANGFAQIIEARARAGGFSVALNWGVNFTTGTGNKFAIGVINSSGAIVSGTLGLINKTWVAGEKWWVRLRVSGTTVTGKAWKLGTAEPSSADATLSNPTSLPADGFSTYRVVSNTSFNIGGQELYYFGLGTGGAVAPYPHLLPTALVNTNSFKIPKVFRKLRPTKLTNTNTFGTPVLTGGAQIAPTKYSDPDTFYTPSISRGGVGLSPTKYTNVNSFGHARITWPIHPTKYADPDSFGTPTVGAFHLVQPTKYTNTNTFGTPKLNQHIYANVYHNVNSFGDHFIDIGNVLHPHRLVDPDVFHSTTVHSTYTLRPEIYQDPDEFFQFHTASFPAVSKERTPFTKERRRYFTAAAAPIYGSIRGRV